MKPNTPTNEAVPSTNAGDSGLTKLRKLQSHLGSQLVSKNVKNIEPGQSANELPNRLETSLLGREEVFIPPSVVPLSPDGTSQSSSTNQGTSASFDKGTIIKGPDILVTPIPGTEDFYPKSEPSQLTPIPLSAQTLDGAINKEQVLKDPEILVTPIPDTEPYDIKVVEGGGITGVRPPDLSHLPKDQYIDKLITPIPGTELQQDFRVSAEDIKVQDQVKILSPLPNQSVIDIEQEISWEPHYLKGNTNNNMSYTIKFWEQESLTKNSQTIDRTPLFASVETQMNMSLDGLLNVSQFTPGHRYQLQVLQYFNKQLVASSAAISFFYTPLLFGSVFLQTTLVPIQLVIREEKDQLSGNVTKVYYFFRNGKWYRILDTKRMHPKDPNGIDLREGIKDPNFTSATPEVSAELNTQFFPPGWEKAWLQFEESSRVQLQILSRLGLQLNGVDPETIALLERIKNELDGGKSVDSIWETYKTQILLIILGVVAAAAVGAIVGKLFRLIFRQKWLKALTHVEKGSDTIIIRVDDSVKAIKDVRKGLDGAIAGQVQTEAGRLYCAPAIATVINTSGKKGAATDLFLEWFKILKKYAKEKGLKEVHIVRTASTDDGVKFLKRLGFKPTGSNKHVKGIGDWELTLPVK